MFRIACSFVCVGCAFVVGCGASTGNVKGKVTLNNKNVSVGQIGFTSEDGSKTFGADVNSDGTFSFTEPVAVGKYKVDYSVPEMDENKETPAVKILRECSVPESFRAEVKGGDNDIPIKLEYKRNQVQEGDV